MQIQHNSRNNFTGALNNKLFLKSLEHISEHGTSFAAGTSLVMSLGVRPLAIYSTPNVEKENKQYACANSVSSGLIKFAIVESVALPIEYAVKKIDNNPEKFLKNKTIDNLKPGSKGYKFATQILKLGAGFMSAIPKSMLTVALIPVVMDNLFSQSKKLKRLSESCLAPKNGVTFTGSFSDVAPKAIGKILDVEWFQNFVNKFKNDDKNVAKHITAATDILLTGASAHQIQKSSKITEERKKPLIYNNLIATGVTLAGGYAIDRAIKSKTASFIEKFSTANKGNPKLSKYVEGINILRPALIFAFIYYGILPMFSTFFSERIDKYLESRKSKV